jgi:hypothetical protein
MNKPHFDFRGNYEKYLPGVPQFLILTKVLHTTETSEQVSTRQRPTGQSRFRELAGSGSWQRAARELAAWVFREEGAS